MVQHKWHKEIKAWADGADIESKIELSDQGISSNWVIDNNPDWNDIVSKFRIKPTPKEPQYLYFFKDTVGNTFARTSTARNSCDTYIGKVKLEVDECHESN